MNIGSAARESGLPAKTIRYYEEIGLISPGRQPNGYRDYDLSDLHKLRFVQRARHLGFSVENCRTLLSLYEDKQRASADVKELARQHLAEVETMIVELNSLREVLTHLVSCCQGDDRPTCPIIDGLAGQLDQ